MTEQSIRAWIKVAKKLISDNKRKTIKEKQHPITKYFTRLTSTMKSSQSPAPHQSTETRNQPSIDDNNIQAHINEYSKTALNSYQHIEHPLTAPHSIPPSTNSVHSAGASTNQLEAHSKDKCASTEASNIDYQLQSVRNKQVQLEETSITGNSRSGLNLTSITKQTNILPSNRTNELMQQVETRGDVREQSTLFPISTSEDHQQHPSHLIVSTLQSSTTPYVPSPINRKNKATSLRKEIASMPKVSACSGEERILIKQTNIPPSNMANEPMEQVKDRKDYNYRTLLGSGSNKCIPPCPPTTREPHSEKLIQSDALSPATEAYNTTIDSSQIPTETTLNTSLGTRISHIFRSYGNYFLSPVTPD